MCVKKKRVDGEKECAGPYKP